MVRAVVFDVGETLLDERGLWHRWADWLDVPRQHFMDTLKGVARRGDASPRAGLVGVFLRRGLWAEVHRASADAIRADVTIDALTELPAAFIRRDGP
jgi:FMN phosphatase YigB (HAD superfamily)